MNPWADKANVEKLKMLHAAGLTFSEIADLMPGTTRNSISGKLFRLGIGKKKKPKNEPPPRAPATVKRVA